MNQTGSTGVVVASSVTGILLFLGFIALGMWGCPQYRVWQQGKAGEARLNRMEQEKRIMIETAEAEVEAAENRAKAIEIMGEAAKKYPEYRQQEFVMAFGEALQENPNLQIIYVPTEGMIPITEANRLKGE